MLGERLDELLRRLFDARARAHAHSLTREAAVVLGERLDELLRRLVDVAEEGGAEALDVQRRVALDLQLAQVVLDDGAAVLQEETARLSERKVHQQSVCT